MLCIAAALLSACGFHLRGQRQLPSAMAVTFIKAADPYGPLAFSLRQQLTASGVQVTNNRKEATAVLHIIRSDSDRRVLSVGSTGKVREFELHQALTFRLLDGEGKALLPGQTVSISRNFKFDETDVLGKVNEAAVVEKEMRQDLIRLMMLRLEAATS